jgi:hypothetical protein
MFARYIASSLNMQAVGCSDVVRGCISMFARCIASSLNTQSQITMLLKDVERLLGASIDARGRPATALVEAAVRCWKRYEGYHVHY